MIRWPQHTGRFRWVVCTLLFLATLINYTDRQILALIKGILDDELHWSALDYGLVNSAFQGSYALSVLFFGWFVDRFGPKISYAVSAGVWSLMAMAHFFAGGVGGFLCARVGLGLGEGGNFPAAIKCVTQWFSPHERAFATSLFNSGANVGAFIAPAIIPLIALTLGWRWAFVVAGVAGILWVVAWLIVYKSPSQDIQSSSGITCSDARPPHPWATLLRQRQTWAFLCAKFLTDPVWWFFLIWLPDLFKRSYGLDIRGSWDKVAAIYATITVLSITAAWLTGRLALRGLTITRARKIVMLGSAICVLPLWIIPGLDVWPAVLLIALAGAAHQAWSANLYTTVSDIFPESAVGSVIGLGSLTGAVGGMLFPLYCGYVLDSYKLHGETSAGYTHLLHLCAFIYLVTFALHHCLAPRFEPLADGRSVRTAGIT
jgi:MFS transporter, ACS family, hexuronate transporter